ncbi:MAG: hypothetical protein IRZ03_17865 [Acidobacterium ailaaui]|nr:hypothetical protein [Pseudacidobacterium ailaaui]
MAFGSTPRDATGIPISTVYVPGTGFVALQGSILTQTDVSGNLSTPVNTNLTQLAGTALTPDSTDRLRVSLYGQSAVAGDTPVLVDSGGRPLVHLARIAGITPPLGTTDALGVGNTFQVSPSLFNGASFDRQRGNVDGLLLIQASGATTTQVSQDQTNYNARGGIFVLDVTNIGSGSITLVIQGKDPVSGKYYTILSGAAVTTNSTIVYRVYPGLTATANATANDLLPRTWRVQVTANNSNATTYTVGAILML